MATQLKLPFGKRITSKQKSARRRNIKVAQAAKKKGGKKSAKYSSKKLANWLMSQPKGKFRGHQ